MSSGGCLRVRGGRAPQQSLDVGACAVSIGHGADAEHSLKIAARNRRRADGVPERRLRPRVVQDGDGGELAVRAGLDEGLDGNAGVPDHGELALEHRHPPPLSVTLLELAGF